MSDPEDISIEAGATSDKVRRLPVHGRWYYVRVFVLAGILLPAIFLGLTVIALIGREVSAPSWVVSRVEAEAHEVLAGGSLAFSSMTVSLGRDLHPRIALINADLRDAEGAPLARIPRVEALISPRGLAFRRELLVQKVALTGAQLALQRSADGSVALAFDSSAISFQQASGFVAMLDELDRRVEAPAFEALEEIAADGLIINFADARAQRNWTVDGGQLNLNLTNGQTRLRGEFSVLSGRDYVTQMSLTYESERGARDAQIGLNVTDAVAADFASQAPALSWLSALDAPLSGSLRGSLDSAGALGPVNAVLEVGSGAIRPNQFARPIPFDVIKTYLTYRPGEEELSFDRIEVQSPWGALGAQGRAYLREFNTNGLPAAMLGQFELSNIVLDPEGFYPEPNNIDAISTDFRLRLQPFSIEVGQFVFSDDAQQIFGSGDVVAGQAGWEVSVDLEADTLTPEFLLSYWPDGIRERSRTWFAENLNEGVFFNMALAGRWTTEEAPRFAGSMEFRDTVVRYMRKLPPVTAAYGYLSLENEHFTASFDGGHISADTGGRLDVAGSVFEIPNIFVRQGPARVDLKLESTITAALSILDEEPFQFLSKAGLPVNIADGLAETRVQIDLPLRPKVTFEDITLEANATISQVRSENLIRGHPLSAVELFVEVDNDGLEISGPARVGAAVVSGRWRQNFGPENRGRSAVSASLRIDQNLLDEFNIGLPEGTLSGASTGELDIAFVRDEPPVFSLESDLAGATLSLDSIGWQKDATAQGRLELEGQLGAVPRVDRLALSGGGLSAEGAVSFIEGGGLDRAIFNDVRIGEWLSAPVTLIGRGADQPVAIEIGGGQFDLRFVEFGDSEGQGGPISVNLQNVQVSEGIALTGFVGEFDAGGGLSGQFTARLNGVAPVRGTIVPQNGRSAVRIRSDDSGSVFAAAGLLQNAEGGQLELILAPTTREGIYDGLLAVTDLRVYDAPALASLLNNLSVIGLLQQMSGQGLVFDTVDARFRLTPEEIVISESSAVGVGLGISLDGVYALTSKNMDFQGVISPFYLINSVGSVLTRRGEGLIGFNYTLSGTTENPTVGVNPLSALTPGMFREIFRRPPPKIEQ